jgi:hypothetical protein
MGSIVAEFDPTASTAAQFSAPQSAANGALVFFNESQNSLTLTFADKSTMYLPAWYHRHKCGSTGSVNISWVIHTTLNSGSPPMSMMIVEAFSQGEHFPADGPLVRQTNGSTNSTVTGTTLVNSGNPPGTADIIKITPSDSALPTWEADNSGNLLIQGDNAGVLTHLLQLIAGVTPAVKLAAVGLLTQILGGAQIDTIIPFSGDSLQLKSQSGTTQVTIADATPEVSIASDLYAAGIVQAHGHMVANLVLPETGNDYAIDVATGHKIALQVNGVDIADVNGSGLAVTGTSKVTGDNYQNITTGDTINWLDANGDVMCAMIDNLSASPTVTGNGLFKASKVLFNIGGIKDMNKGTFSASGTYNHGLSGTPTIVLLCPSLSGSTWTFSAYTFTSTQFSATIVSANNTNWFAYR